MQTAVRHRWTLGILLVILLVAGTLRLFKLDELPPGLHVDEASHAWNAYTLLKTGKDQHGVRWPIFYSRLFGDNASTSFIYALLPFQAIGGMNVTTARLPSAVGGVLTVLLIYFVGARLFGCVTGLVAAAMLAVNPWHLQTSRFGVDAGSPFLILASLAAFLWANMPFDDDEQRRPRPVIAALAGAMAGISCYGYPAVRLFLPVFLIGAVLVTWNGWWRRLKTREGALAIGALIVAGAITFGPLLWKHLTDPEISRRGRIQGWVWSESDTLAEKIGKALERYPGHFGADFLFKSGDGDPAYAPPEGTGLFHWYDLPFMLAGLLACLARARSSRAARFLLLWIILYPVADLLTKHPSMHSMRSLPGIGGLVLLEAVGAATAGKWLWQRQRQIAAGSYCAAALLVLFLNVRFLQRFFGPDFFPQRYFVGAYGADIMQAAEWLKPQLKDVDAVFVTGRATHPYIFTLVGLGYDPEQWFRDVHEVVPGPLPNGTYQYEDVYRRFGKFRFMVDASSLAKLKELMDNDRRDHVIFIVRPVELRLNEQTRPIEEQTRPVYEIRCPGCRGAARLLIYDLYL
jgi:4-amino-4-deoxy-L-arabinose transferase-like glycosyltransferase